MQLILMSNKPTSTVLRTTLRYWRSFSSSSSRTRIHSVEKTSTQHGQSPFTGMIEQAAAITTEPDSSNTCPICFDITRSILTAPCNHSFCATCYKTWFTTQQQSCPLCRQGYNTNDASSRKTSTSSTASISLNAIYNQALIDNYRIQRARLPKEVKEQSKLLLAEMHEMERIPNHFAGLERDGRLGLVEDVEAYLTERQLAIAALLLEGRG
jgi:hypothetical protein